MRKFISLLLIATMVVSTLSVSYFAIDDNSTQNNTTETTTEPVTETSSTVVTTEPVTESSTKTSVPEVVKVSSVGFSKGTVLLKKKGNKITLNAIVRPNNANNRNVTWSVGKSYKKNIAVNRKGIVKALKNNTFGWVYATAKDGSKKSAKCLVIVGNRANKVQIGKYRTKNVKTKKGTKKVKNFIKLDNLRIGLNRGYIFDKRVTNETTKKIKKGKKTIKKTSYKKVAYVGVTWKSSNTKVVSVDKTGKIKGLKRGSATITATTMDGSRKVVKCKVSVIKYVSKITFKENLKSSIDKGGYRQLGVKIEPKDASIKNVKWSSSNTNVATVDKNGRVKGINYGSATITATTVDGSNKKANFKVSVDIGFYDNITKEEFCTDKNVKRFCDDLNAYFRDECGAVINPNMVGSDQWCITSSDMFRDKRSMYDFKAETVSLWTDRRVVDSVDNGELGWKDIKHVGSKFYNFLDEIDNIGNVPSSGYNPKKC